MQPVGKIDQEEIFLLAGTRSDQISHFGEKLMRTPRDILHKDDSIGEERVTEDGNKI